MELLLCTQLWGHDGSLAALIADVTGAGFGGIEGAPPVDPSLRRELVERAGAAGLRIIGEISTGIFLPGKWVPDPGTTVEQHLETFRRLLDRCLEMRPVWITCMGGNDLWSVRDGVRFYAAAMEIAAAAGTEVSFETHRGRSLYHPVPARQILEELPELQLTCDFSHWCVVCERLVVEELPDLLALAATRARHVHARVGYDQGAQVPHPRAPEYAEALAAHEGWWDAIWQAQAKRGLALSTMTAESGPDGYLHCAPFTREPVADLWEINRWIGQRQQQRFPYSREETGA